MKTQYTTNQSWLADIGKRTSPSALLHSNHAWHSAYLEPKTLIYNWHQMQPIAPTETRFGKCVELIPSAWPDNGVWIPKCYPSLQPSDGWLLKWWRSNFGWTVLLRGRGALWVRDPPEAEPGHVSSQAALHCQNCDILHFEVDPHSSLKCDFFPYRAGINKNHFLQLKSFHTAHRLLPVLPFFFFACLHDCVLLPHSALIARLFFSNQAVQLKITVCQRAVNRRIHLRAN